MNLEVLTAAYISELVRVDEDAGKFKHIYFAFQNRRFSSMSSVKNKQNRTCF